MNYFMFNSRLIHVFMFGGVFHSFHFFIVSYFKFMRTSTGDPYFYCANREEKILPDGSAIRFRDYHWGGTDVIIDGPCPWYQKYPIWRPTFWYPFDGTIMHRLVNFSTTL